MECYRNCLKHQHNSKKQKSRLLSSNLRNRNKPPPQKNTYLPFELVVYKLNQNKSITLDKKEDAKCRLYKSI